VGIEVEETINTECDDIEETTVDRNEVHTRQLSQTETDEPCDVPSHLIYWKDLKSTCQKNKKFN
jgi:hypothetical protein